MTGDSRHPHPLLSLLRPLKRIESCIHYQMCLRWISPCMHKSIIPFEGTMSISYICYARGRVTAVTSGAGRGRAASPPAGSPAGAGRGAWRGRGRPARRRRGGRASPGSGARWTPGMSWSGGPPRIQTRLCSYPCRHSCSDPHLSSLMDYQVPQYQVLSQNHCHGGLMIFDLLLFLIYHLQIHILGLCNK